MSGHSSLVILGILVILTNLDLDARAMSAVCPLSGWWSTALSFYPSDLTDQSVDDNDVEGIVHG